jgi:putative peptidoglycan lipid II flippase
LGVLIRVQEDIIVSKVMRSAAVMGAATFISRIMGLVREIVFAALFGAGNATDAFITAFRIPNLLRDLFAEGAMSASLVPTFTKVREQQGERRAWRVAGLVFRVLFVIVASLALLGIIFAPQLVALYAPAFKAIPGKFELTVSMTRMMFPFFPLVALAAAFMGILNACGRFFMPALSSALFNLASVVTGVAFALLFTAFPLWGIHPIQGMAIGVIIGGLVQALCQLPALRTCGYRFPAKEKADPVWHKDPALRSMLWLMIPGTIGLAATQINILVNTILATSQGTGAVSWLNYAFRLMQFPIGIFGVSIAAATLPAVSKLWIRKDINGVRDTIETSLSHVFAINLPAAAGLAFLSGPIIQLIYENGKFRPADTHATAVALVCYAAGLAAYSAVKVLVPAFYALGNTKIPVIASVLSVCINICLNLVMVHRFGYWGLALGTSFTAFLNAAFLVGALKIKLNRSGGSFSVLHILQRFFIHSILALCMGSICWISFRYLSLFVHDDLVSRFIGHVSVPLVRVFRVGLVVFEGAAVIVILAKVFRIKETEDMYDMFAGKFMRMIKKMR